MSDTLCHYFDIIFLLPMSTPRPDTWDPGEDIPGTDVPRNGDPGTALVRVVRPVRAVPRARPSSCCFLLSGGYCIKIIFP